MGGVGMLIVDRSPGGCVADRRAGPQGEKALREKIEKLLK
jgi:hypothetical protein